MVQLLQMTLLMMAYWHHLVALKPNNANLGGVVFYVDGATAADNGNGGSTFNLAESTNFTIGGDRASTRINFIGTIDDFRSLHKELNATAISALYASGAGEGYYTPTLAVLTIDEYANTTSVPVSVTFKRGGSNLPVAGFAPGYCSQWWYS